VRAHRSRRAMPAALRRTLIVLAALAAAFALGALPASARPTDDVGDEAAFVSRMNADRAGAGLRTYATAGDLVTVARRHAQRMADRGEHYHNPNLANEVGGWSMLGENVGQGFDVDGLHRAFMQSPAHRANILSRSFTQVGVGVARSADGRLFVVEVFRQPAQVAAAPAPASAPAPRPAPAPAPAPAPKPQPAPAPPPPTTVAPAPPAPTTTVRPTQGPEAPPATVAALVASVAPASSPVDASLSAVANPSVAGPAMVAALLIAGLLPALARASRQVRPAP
jgi:uncharacterized protein YkwD